MARRVLWFGLFWRNRNRLRKTTMRKMKQKPYSETKSSRKKTARLYGALACAAALPVTVATVKADGPSHTDLLFNVDFANQYVTPRGMMVRNQGLTVQPLLLG